MRNRLVAFPNPFPSDCFYDMPGVPESLVDEIGQVNIQRIGPIMENRPNRESISK